MARNHKPPEQTLVLVPMRITNLQSARLTRLEATTTLPKQDHIRRALDFYMNAVEKSAGLPPMPVLPEQS